MADDKIMQPSWATSLAAKKAENAEPVAVPIGGVVAFVLDGLEPTRRFVDGRPAEGEVNASEDGKVEFQATLKVTNAEGEGDAHTVMRLWLDEAGYKKLAGETGKAVEAVNARLVPVDRQTSERNSRFVNTQHIWQFRADDLVPIGTAKKAD